MKTTYVFLVRIEDDIVVRSKKPADVKILGSRTWCVWRDGKRAFDYTESIGDNHRRFLCSDNYTGTVGVFDISKPSHMKALVKAAISNRQEQLGYELVIGLRGVFGEKVWLEAGTTRHTGFRGQQKKLPKNVRKYREIESMIHDTCRPVI